MTNDNFKEIKTERTITETTTTFEVTVVHNSAKKLKFDQIFNIKTRRAKVANWNAKELSSQTQTRTIEETKQVDVAYLKADNRAIRQSVKEAAIAAGFEHVAQKTQLKKGSFQLRSSFKTTSSSYYVKRPWIQIKLGIVNQTYSAWRNSNIIFQIKDDALVSRLWARHPSRASKLLKAELKFADPEFSTKLTAFIKYVGDIANGNIVPESPHKYLTKGTFK